ncbi:MAG TPA: response regulator, partial [bacterium]|nr:response regulator [bacterium]
RIGFSGYLVKPVREAALKDTLEVVWGARKHGTPQGLVTRHLIDDSTILKGLRDGTGLPSAVAPRDEVAPPSRRVLVAQSDALEQRVAQAMLESFGLAVDVASDGGEVLDAHELVQYDAIFLDPDLSGLDGLRAVRLIREREEGSSGHTPLVAMSARAGEDDRERCLAAGVDDFLAKPHGRDAVRRILDQWVPAGIPDA